MHDDTTENSHPDSVPPPPTGADPSCTYTRPPNYEPLADLEPEVVETLHVVAKDHSQYAPPGYTADGRRSMSAILLELASQVATEIPVCIAGDLYDFRLDLAKAAWNYALGKTAFYNSLAATSKSFNEQHPHRAPDNIAVDHMHAMIKYRRFRYPQDRREVLCARIVDEEYLQVVWTEPHAPQPRPGQPQFGAMDRIRLPRAAQLYPPNPERVRIWRGLPQRESVAAALLRQLRTKASLRDRLQMLCETNCQGRAAIIRTARASVKSHCTPLTALWLGVHNRLGECMFACKSLPQVAEAVEFFRHRAVELEFASTDIMEPIGVYFSFWSTHDHPIGPDDETWGQTVLKLCAGLGIENPFTELAAQLTQVHPGVYVHEGWGDDGIRLRDFVTGETCQVRLWPDNPYRGRRGDLWYTRVLPNVLDDGGPNVTMGPPYVLLHEKHPPAQAWQRHFQTHVPTSAGDRQQSVYQRHMKFGPTPLYWTSFIHDTFSHRENDIGFLSGMPVLPATEV